MGCGASADSRFTQLPGQRAGEITAAAVGQRVHVVGRAAHCGTVLHCPFSDRQAIGCKVNTYLPSKTMNKPFDKPNFKCRGACVPFLVTDGAHSLRVAPRGGEMLLKQTHMELNIDAVRDEDGSVCLRSGGTALWAQTGLCLKPHAKDFWDAFNGGKDPVSGWSIGPRVDTTDGVLVATGLGAMAAMGAFRKRTAKEYSFEVGEAVAVVGTLVESGDELELQDVIITNVERHSPALQSVPPQGPSAEQMRVVPMSTTKL